MLTPITQPTLEEERVTLGMEKREHIQEMFQKEEQMLLSPGDPGVWCTGLGHALPSSFVTPSPFPQVLGMTCLFNS